ncbi:MAG: glycerophosphodiester phosphodiesterase [Romboutsia sp.]|nr:glycerophosphodiester phosphodiesterase [Romboutsia sp.]
MKNNKKQIKKLIIIFIFLALFGTYFYAIQGEKLNKNQISWITEYPIAHRGFDNGDIPENSIESFKKAIEYNYAIELDVQLTKDKELIVLHDSNLSRVTGDNRDVRDVTYDELKDLKLENTDETIPTLKEVLELVDNKVPLFVEIKDGKGAKELAAKTYDIMKDYEGRYVIQSFNPFILQWFKENANEVIRCQLSCDFKGEQNAHLKWYEKFLLKNLLLNFLSRPHIIAYDLDAINNLPVKLLKDKYPIISWTIKTEEQMKKGYEKTDNIIFDNVLP